MRSLLGMQSNKWGPSIGSQSCHSPLSNIGKIEEVLGMQAPHRDGRAGPEQAFLLLGVDAQHATAFPGVRVLQAGLGSWSDGVRDMFDHAEQSAIITICCWQQEQQTACCHPTPL